MADGSSNIPSRAQQKCIISSLSLRQCTPYYNVSKQWYQTWESYVGINCPLTSSDVIYPGPITSGDQPVHEDVFRYLAIWYGISCNKLNFISRTFDFEDRNKFIIEPEIALRPEAHYLSYDAAPRVRVHLPENVGYIEGELRRICEVPSGKKSRLWVKLTGLRENKSQFQLLLSHGIFIGHDPQGSINPFIDPSSLKLPLQNGLSNIKGSYGTQICSPWRSIVYDEIAGERKAAPILNLNMAKSAFRLEVTDEKGNWPSGLPGKPDITSSMTLVNFDKNRPEASENDGQLPPVAARHLCETMQGHLTEILIAAENMNTELEKDITPIRLSLVRKLARVDELEKQLADKAKHVLQLEENLSVERDVIRKERDDVQAARNSLDSELKKMEEINKIQEGTVTLNVGGKKHMTSIMTLTKDADSLLSAMFSGRHPLKQSEDGSYFLDRDGTNFRYVLNYLRDGGMASNLPADPIIRAELKTEAMYYQLKGLVQILSQKQTSDQLST